MRTAGVVTRISDADGITFMAFDRGPTGAACAVLQQSKFCWPFDDVFSPSPYLTENGTMMSPANVNWELLVPVANGVVLFNDVS